MYLHIQTPLVESAAFSTKAQRVWLKVEAAQPCGSFKLRGVGHACNVYKKQGAKRFLTSSGGNSGLAVAYAGNRFDVPVLVVVPETTSARAKALIQQQGAEVLVFGKSWQEANEHLMNLRAPTDAFIHPFDESLLWDGHATMIDEVAAEGLKPDAVVLSVGGGGLMCGVLQGMHQHGWADIPLVAVETVGAASLHAAIKNGELTTLNSITSVATSLGARRVCAKAFEWTSRHPVDSVTVTDAQAVRACLQVADQHRMIVEPACGAAVAAVLSQASPVLSKTKNVLVILCGGVSASYDDLKDLAG